MKRDTGYLISDILVEINNIINFVDELDEKEFSQNPLIKNAVIRS